MGCCLGASDELTWRKPRSVAIVIAWGFTNTAIILNAFLSGRQIMAWYDFVLVLFVSAFAGVLLADVKTIVLGIFESLFLSVLLMYIALVLPVLLGNVAGFYQANLIYWVSLGLIFKAFFPLAVFAYFLGGMLGGFAEDLLL